MKTTRIRSLGGEQIIFSNNELLKNRIPQLQTHAGAARAVGVGIAYETPIEQVRSLPGIMREIVSCGMQTRFDRAHFKGHGDSALRFEVVYFVLDPDFNKYMDIQQAINLALLEPLAARGISLAHPVRMPRLAPEQMQAAAAQLASIPPAVSRAA